MRLVWGLQTSKRSNLKEKANYSNTTTTRSTTRRLTSSWPSWRKAKLKRRPRPHWIKKYNIKYVLLHKVMLMNLEALTFFEKLQSSFSTRNWGIFIKDKGQIILILAWSKLKNCIISFTVGGTYSRVPYWHGMVV